MMVFVWPRPSTDVFNLHASSVCVVVLRDRLRKIECVAMAFKRQTVMVLVSR